MANVLGSVRLSHETESTISPDGQGEQIKGWSDLHDHTVIHMAQDLEVSGAVALHERPGLGPWLTEPDKIAQWDIICVAELDRLSQSLLDTAEFIRWCQENGKTIVSAGEPLDFSGAMGRMFAQQLAMYAEFERERISERRAKAAARLRRKAQWGGGRPPFGYMPVKEDDYYVLVPNPATVPVVMRIAADIIAGKSCNQIARDLNAENVPSSQGGPGMQASVWRAQGIIVLMRNPALRGLVMQDDHHGKSVIVRDDDGNPVTREAIVDKETWDNVQEALDKNGISPELARAAESARGFMPTPEGLALYDTAATYAHLGPVAEIGTYCGKSTIYLAAAAREAGQLVVTVDHHRGSEENQPGLDWHDAELVDPATGRLDTLPHFRSALAATGLEEHVIAVVGRSTSVAGLWRTPVGMLFIDGGHTDALAQADYEAWAPWVVEGGALAIHDVFPDPADGAQGPYRMYLRALKSGAFTEVRVEGSLRVLERTGPGIG